MSKKYLVKNEFGAVTTSSLNADIAFIDIQHQHCTAKVSLYGGQVLAWQPNKQQPVFWLSKAATYQQGKAIRGGIPLCWPWFGPFVYEELNEKQAGASIQNHGFARLSQWQFESCVVTEQGVNLILTLQGENTQACWPYAFKVTQHLFFGSHFKQSLLMLNNTTQAIKYNGALHSYFCVSAPDNVQIPALANVEFDDKLTGEHCFSPANVSCVGPIDRVYHSTNNMHIIDEKWHRTIIIETDNTQQWVLWNPGKVGAEAMADVHQHGEDEYICLEAANTNWQTIAANSEVSISQTIRIV